MSSKPTVSIIIPVYNRPLLLKRALQSVISQTYTDWECVIVDDGSTDDTGAVAQQFAEHDPRFRVIQNRHAGGNKATNDGLRGASGTYITLLGSDDEYTPEHLQLRITEMQMHPAIDMLHGGMLVIGDEYVPDKYDISRKISLYDPTVYVGGTIFAKARVFRDLNGFTKMPYASDSDFIERAIQKFQVKKVHWQTYIYHRDHTDSVTHNIARNVQTRKSEEAKRQLRST